MLGKTVSPRTDNLTEQFIRDGGEIKKVKARTLFTLKGNPQLNKESFAFSKDSKYPYFTRTIFNNGIYGYVDYLDEEHLIKGNSLAVGMMAMQFFYMSHDFYAGQFTKTAFPLFEGFDEKVALWFISWFNKSSKRFLGVLVRDFEETFYETELEVPYKNGKVDVDFIRERVRELEEERVRELEAYLKAAGFADCTLNIKESDAINRFTSVKWKTFRVGDLFIPLKVKKAEKAKVRKYKDQEFKVPVVYCKFGNNGIMYWGKEGDFTTYENVISIIYNGAIATGKVYTQKERTGILAESYFIKYKHCEVSHDINLFFSTVLEKKLYPKYSRDNLATWNGKVETDLIYLPVNDNNEIDYAFMETYISAIKKQTIARLIEFIKCEKEAYRIAINN